MIRVLGRIVASLAPRDGQGDPRGALADSLGAFRYEGVAPGYYLLEVRRPPLLSQTHELRILPGLTDTICVALRSQPMELPEVR